MSHLQLGDSISTIGGDAIQEEDTMSLEAQERRIIDVSRQLTGLIQEYNASVISLARRASASPNYPFGPHIPDEIILHIFSYIVEEGTHRIKPLLLTNRRFYEVAMSSPVLWNKITIVINARLEEVNRLSINYLNTCFKRSQEARLTVILDFSSVPGSYEYLTSFYKEAIRELPYASSVLPEIQDVLGQLDDDARYTARVNELNELIRTLAAQANRWQSAAIFLPATKAGGIIATFWKLFLGSPPSSSSLGGRFMEEIDQYYCLNGFPHLANIERCTLWGPRQIGKVAWNFGVLKELFFEASWMDSSLYKLSSCVNLQVLTIHVGGPNVNPSRSPLMISLPSLIELNLLGHVNGLLGIEFQAPRLTRLTLQYWYLPRQYLPRVRPRCVTWLVLEPPGTLDLLLAKRGVSRLLNEYTEMEILNIDDFPSIEAAVETVTEVMQGCNSSAPLQMIQFTQQGNSITTLRRNNNWVPCPPLE
ncbi:hypothetical protein FRC17_001105 [Serendipita sp. 399]|nr:hypothetical protein FRC17_001105 [Serendipita sp. 399]